MKIKLLNDGGFIGLKNVNFPVTVDAIYMPGGAFAVEAAVIISLPGNTFRRSRLTSELTSFTFLDSEVEVVE